MSSAGNWTFIGSLVLYLFPTEEPDKHFPKFFVNGRPIWAIRQLGLWP